LVNRVLHGFRSSLSAKIALLVTVPSILIVLFFSGYHYFFERQSILRNAKTDLLLVAEDMKSPAEGRPRPAGAAPP